MSSAACSGSRCVATPPCKWTNRKLKHIYIINTAKNKNKINATNTEILRKAAAENARK